MLRTLIYSAGKRNILHYTIAGRKTHRRFYVPGFPQGLTRLRRQLLKPLQLLDLRRLGRERLPPAECTGPPKHGIGTSSLRTSATAHDLITDFYQGSRLQAGARATDRV